MKGKVGAATPEYQGAPKFGATHECLLWVGSRRLAGPCVAHGIVVF